MLRSMNRLLVGTLVGAVAVAVTSCLPWIQDTTPLPVVPMSGEPALAVLQQLPVQEWASGDGYNRAQFGPKWTDDVDAPAGRNGCDQRSDVLRRDLSNLVVKPGTAGCKPIGGILDDPYTGLFVELPDIEGEHVVALQNAWVTGAQQLSERERQNLAGDPLVVLAVQGSANSSKGERDASDWLPPNPGYRCAYVARQIAVKAKYRLWVTRAEKSAMTEVLDRCPDQLLPTADDVAIPALRP